MTGQHRGRGGASTPGDVGRLRQVQRTSNLCRPLRFGVISTREKRGAGSTDAGAGSTQFQAFAVTAPGLAPFAALELSALGIDPGTVDAAGVAFAGDLRAVARANLELRAVSRVLVRVDEFRAATFHELEKRSARIEWARWLSPGREVSLRVTCRKSRLYHSGAVAERVATELARHGARIAALLKPDDEPDDETAGEEREEAHDAQLLVVRLLHDRCTISLDSSGALLHRRGYRQATGKAPLRETLGAALLMASGWEAAMPLIDPFCGSGTIAIEAAMMARRMPPGRSRRFAFERWPGVDPALMPRLRAQASARELPSAPAPIVASDRDAGAVDAARANAERAGVADDIAFHVRTVSSLALPAGAERTGAVVTNPPYGVRVGDVRTLRNLYARTGDVLRTVCPGWRVALVASDRRLVGMLKLSLDEHVRTNTGGLSVTFAVGRVAEGDGAIASTAPTDSIG